MRGISYLKGSAVALATLGLTFPQVRLSAGEQLPRARTTIKITAPNTIFDVRLANAGEFTGRVINHEGTAMPGTKVIVRRGKAEVGQSLTDERGNFAVRNLKPGLYEVHAGATVGNYRMWTETAAPPSAKPHGLLVLGQNGARGQYGLSETIAGDNLGLILLASMTGMALAGLIIALHAERISDEAKDIAKKAFHSP